MTPHAQTWKDQQGPQKRIPTVPLLQGRVYHNAATHGDVAAFRQRQIERGLKPCQR